MSIICRRLYLSLVHRTQGSPRLVLPIYLSTLTRFLMFPSTLFLVIFSCLSYLGTLMRLTPTTNPYSLVYHWKSTGLLCGWIWLCTKVSIGMTITNIWKPFICGIKRYHYKKLISIREFLEQLDIGCFNNIFTTDTGTPKSRKDTST